MPSARSTRAVAGGLGSSVAASSTPSSSLLTGVAFSRALARGGSSSTSAPAPSASLEGRCKPAACGLRWRRAGVLPGLRGGARAASRRHAARRGAGGGAGASSEDRTPFPFDAEDYIEVAMQLVKPTVVRENNQANLILYARNGGFLDLFQSEENDAALLSRLQDERCLVVEIGGDTVLNITAAMESAQFMRPLALDLLWKILRRGRELSDRDWALVRVAIVDLREGTFIGRLFFGDRGNPPQRGGLQTSIDADDEPPFAGDASAAGQGLGTGTAADASGGGGGGESSAGGGVSGPRPARIYWDCDCRPSDGIWLALQSKCPVYVRKDVWDAASVPLSKLVKMQNEEERIVREGIAAIKDAIGIARDDAALGEERTSEDPNDPTAPSDNEPALADGKLRLREGDPDAIKRLKRELRVALREEDYQTAIRIRDHPFMRLYAAWETKRDEGQEEEAEMLNEELWRAIRESGEGDKTA